MSNAFRTSFYPEEVKVRYASYILKDKARGWWKEGSSELGDDDIDVMSCDDFSTKFGADFTPVIKVQQLP